MKYLVSYFSNTFAKYFMKWQLGFIVTVPCMYLFTDILQWPDWATVIAFNADGSFIFWPIDSFIFRKDE